MLPASLSILRNISHHIIELQKHKLGSELSELYHSEDNCQGCLQLVHNISTLLKRVLVTAAVIKACFAGFTWLVLLYLPLASAPCNPLEGHWTHHLSGLIRATVSDTLCVGWLFGGHGSEMIKPVKKTQKQSYRRDLCELLFWVIFSWFEVYPSVPPKGNLNAIAYNGILYNSVPQILRQQLCKGLFLLFKHNNVTVHKSRSKRKSIISLVLKNLTGLHMALTSEYS